MKHALLVLLAVVALPAFAQSGVTVYGVLDYAAQYLDGTTRLVRGHSGGLSGSRIGFRGAEDLGDGLKAVYTLESGLNVDDGSVAQNGLFWGRQAFVGLESGWGRLTLGRQYSSLYTATADYSVFSQGPSGASTAVIGGFGSGYEPVRGATSATGMGGPARINNSLRYETPRFGGFQANVLYGAGEVAGSTRGTRLLDLGLRYAAGGFSAIASFIDDTASPGGTTVVDARTTTFAAAYASAPFRVVAGALVFEDRRPAGLDGRGYWLGGEYRRGVHSLKVQYVRNAPRYGSDNATDVLGVGWSCSLSARTALYASVARFVNEAGAGSGGLGRLHSAVPAGLTSPGHNSITEGLVGMRHSF